MARWVQRTWQVDGAGAGLLSAADRRPGQFRAYVPDELNGARQEFQPATIRTTERALQTVARADAQVGSETAFLNRLLIRSESIASSYIEGQVVSPKRLAVADAIGRGDRTALTVMGNVRATEQAVQDLSAPERQVTIADLVALQHLIAPNVPSGVRTVQNWVGGQGFSPLRAAFVPPPPEFVPDLLADLLAYLNRDDMNPIVQAALVHARFETIHPFIDGNGRVGRALIHTVLRRAEVTRNALVPVSTVFAAHTDQYLGGLTAIRAENPVYDGWILGFCEALQEASITMVRLAEQALSVDQRLAEQLVTYRREQGRSPAVPRRDALVRRTLAVLRSEPVLTVGRVQELFGVSQPTAFRALDGLTRAKILSRIRDQRNGSALCYASDAHLHLVALTGRG